LKGCWERRKEGNSLIDQSIIQPQLGLGKISGVNDPKLHGTWRGEEGREGRENAKATGRECLYIADAAWCRRKG